MDFQYRSNHLSATIGSASGTSSTIDLQGYTLVAILTPGTMTGGTITFLGSYDNSNFYPVYDTAGNQLAVIAGTNRILTDIPEIAPLRYMQLTMGTQAQVTNFALLVK